MKLFKLMVLSFILVACRNIPAKSQDTHKTLIGTLENGQTNLTVDQAKLLAVYNANLLKFSNIDAKFTEVSIKTTSSKQYILVFKSGHYTSSLTVTAIHSKLYATNNISCTTSDCSSEEIGCSPKPSELGCWPCNNGGKCTKTVTSISLIE